jgi:protease-4
MSANTIFAEPQTITGSIGVVGMVPNVEGVFDWVGIKPERLTRGRHAAALMTNKGLDDAAKEMIRGHMVATYEDFVAKVAAGRGKTPADIEPIARGRVWTGRKAKEIGLVDRLGGLEDAITDAKARGNIPVDAKEGSDWHLLELPRRKGPFEMLDELFSMRLGIESAVLDRMPELRRVLWQIQLLRSAGRDKICMINPELAGLLHPFEVR